jgi:hypothetical protein
VRCRSGLLAVCLILACAHAAAPERPALLSVRVRVTPGLPLPASGRLIVFASPDGVRQRLPLPTWVGGVDVPHPQAGQVITVNPLPLSGKVEPGRLRVLAFLDGDRSAPYSMEADPGDLVSPEVVVDAGAGVADLALARVKPPYQYPASPDVVLEEVESPLLTAFWGHPVELRAAVVLPPGYRESTSGYPTAFQVHGYTGDYRFMATRKLGPQARQAMTAGNVGAMILVFLDAHIASGHHVFADSVNNGPWATALVTELIPHLERRYRMAGRPDARFLTGQSSGGWAAVWLQVTHPDFFGGAWPTAPDPLSFEDFMSGMNLRSPPPALNAYRLPDGSPRGFLRDQGQEVLTFREYATFERTLGDLGGNLASFEATFSPRGPDGRPLPLFDRDSGLVDPEVARAWSRYDIDLLLESHWKDLGPRLRGKLHVFVGEQDSFHLDGPTRLLCRFLAANGEGSACTIVPGRTHFSLSDSHPLYPRGLFVRILEEMSPGVR